MDILVIYAGLYQGDLLYMKTMNKDGVFLKKTYIDANFMIQVNGISLSRGWPFLQQQKSHIGLYVVYLYNYNGFLFSEFNITSSGLSETKRAAIFTYVDNYYGG